MWIDRAAIYYKGQQLSASLCQLLSRSLPSLQQPMPRIRGDMSIGNIILIEISIIIEISIETGIGIKKLARAQ